MSKALDKYKAGDWNQALVEIQPDGSKIITLTKEGRKKPDRFRVRNLYQPDEEELNVNTAKPIAKRDLQ